MHHSFINNGTPGCLPKYSQNKLPTLVLNDTKVSTLISLFLPIFRTFFFLFFPFWFHPFSYLFLCIRTVFFYFTRAARTNCPQPCNTKYVMYISCPWQMDDTEERRERSSCSFNKENFERGKNNKIKMRGGTGKKMSCKWPDKEKKKNTSETRAKLFSGCLPWQVVIVVHKVRKHI